MTISFDSQLSRERTKGSAYLCRYTGLTGMWGSSAGITMNLRMPDGTQTYLLRSSSKVWQKSSNQER